ncbi:zinc finger (C3HC4-type RING finger) family protein [Arabidopsis thaliana]|uniref:E3 ubiquitin-protein ligase ORTHRUS 3 n=1 Tax=Arabidopsis thaliana TaxID=3702 RepID=ORTH3_ARATH|nr:zinc finger (C3HC4-type RING finger) family protein [Arabidopsis thaliana]Q9FVS2.2 RecName: Full=E3 ubiquitin-protein ligase ORTHRUS 3; AltName: Full=Protein VARIANT IN METHYLATION 5; AltName: Full=RING-type E3 ubiquitin transferase ORTHRUS 3 [Arabidopsis thaliana]AEE33468.1 zinc finger (C3HC4-type RING finger) family protein [Arabidopsis thaliana]|eukprot:NP_176091.2 zinc finger (C3HC4-type RING finger) family protein [Arabidopsis thaliana]
MTPATQYPCDPEGVCMRCKSMPPPEESLTCGTCVTPWHVSCLLSPPETLSATLQWLCPDCSGETNPLPVSGVAAGYGSVGSDLVAAIHSIEADETLSAEEKAKKKQQLLSGKGVVDEDDEEEKKKTSKGKKPIDVLSHFECSFCMQSLQKPVSVRVLFALALMLVWFLESTPCGHNACLKCFLKWMGQGHRSCGTCRSVIPESMVTNPRINLSIVSAIRLARVSEKADARTSKVVHYVDNEDRPDKAFTTERAKKTGNANASSGKIFVTIPRDHFGPIPAENDPVRNQGLLVGESWKGRLACRQWGAHFPHVSGIAGQASYGAQSVVLAGGYDDDEDHGEWFLYTGSGGRILKGNKRTNTVQAFDQVFLNFNEALRLSCKLGYPVRVVRSTKDKRSPYAPQGGLLRYDGVYRIEKCWRIVGIQMCRFLFVRCDNEPAPWTSDEHGDRPRPLPNVPELNMATDLFERKESPSWDFDEGEDRWRWMKPPPASKKAVKNVLDPEERKLLREAIKSANPNTMRARLLKEFKCQICQKVMTNPVTTPCAHNFCKACLESKFAGTALVRERGSGGRKLRSQKSVMKCPCCPTDIAEFVQNPQVNREVAEVIEKLKKQEEEENAKSLDEGQCSGTSHEEEDDEQPKKRIKLDTDAEVSATVVESDMK